MPADAEHPYVSRGGLKLAAALDAFALKVKGRVVADLGASVGGFTDCLIQRGAACVWAVDTAYGQLAWRLRQDARVRVLERTNVLHVDPAATVAGFVPCELVVLDLGWTPQAKALPAARRWLTPGGRVLTLVKPQYEPGGARARGGGGRHVLEDAAAQAIVQRALEAMPGLGFRVLADRPSPIRGGGRRRGGAGNLEHLALLEWVGGDGARGDSEGGSESAASR